MLDITDSVSEHIICYGYICRTLVCVVVESLSECWILLTAFLSTSPPCRAPYVGFGDIIDCTLALRRIAAKPSARAPINTQERPLGFVRNKEDSKHSWVLLPRQRGNQLLVQLTLAINTVVVEIGVFFPL